MAAFLTDVMQQKLLDEQDALLQRRPYQRGGDGRKRNGFKPLRIKSLFSNMILQVAGAAREDPAIPDRNTFPACAILYLMKIEFTEPVTG